MMHYPHFQVNFIADPELNQRSSEELFRSKNEIQKSKKINKLIKAA